MVELVKKYDSGKSAVDIGRPVYFGHGYCEYQIGKSSAVHIAPTLAVISYKIFVSVFKRAKVNCM